MTPERYLLPRNSLLWMLGAQALSLLPLFWHMPLWLPVVWLLVLGWRLQEFRGRWELPGRFTRFTLVVTVIAGLLLSFRGLLGLEPMVALLICALLLKLLEMRHRRDALLVLYLNFFLIGVQFLFGQALEHSLYGLLSLWAALTSLLVVHQGSGQSRPGRSLRLAGRLLLHSIPLMLLMFLVMPRLGALWSVPSPQAQAKTGVSGEMSPGDYSQLSRSGEVAFRVTFEGEAPSQQDLYWRGLVFSAFDGRTWRQQRQEDYRGGAAVFWGYEQQPAWYTSLQHNGEAFRYSVVQEPTQQAWLFSLTLPQSPADRGIGIARDFRVLRDEPVTTRYHYQLTSHLQSPLEIELPTWRHEQETQLPAKGNPKARAAAVQWLAESGSVENYIQRLMGLYRDEFIYTLEPPALGVDSVDQFLWQTRKGFCEHFASSFVFMLRAAGIPARVVAGYLGGEYNALGNYWVIHQYDAHAWAEVWLQGRGWVRFDPTLAVAPERIQQSLGDSRFRQVEGVMSLGRYRNIPLFSELRLRWDLVNYRWHQLVMNFDDEEQRDLLQNWFGAVDPLRLMLMVLVGGGALLLLVALHLWWQSRPAPRTPLQRSYQRFERLVAKRGWVRKKGETSEQFLQRMLAGERYQSYRSLIEQCTFCYQQAMYGEEILDENRINTLLKQLNKMTRLK